MLYTEKDTMDIYFILIATVSMLASLMAVRWIFFKILKIAKEKNLERIILEVRATNEPALSLYKRKGFKELGIRKNFYDNPKEDALLMSVSVAR